MHQQDIQSISQCRMRFMNNTPQKEMKMRTQFGSQPAENWKSQLGKDGGHLASP